MIHSSSVLVRKALLLRNLLQTKSAIHRVCTSNKHSIEEHWLVLEFSSATTTKALKVAIADLLPMSRL